MQEIDSIINIEEEIDKQISDKYLPNYNNITNNITNNMNNELIDDNDKEEVELTVKDVFESHSEYKNIMTFFSIQLVQQMLRMENLSLLQYGQI